MSTPGSPKSESKPPSTQGSPKSESKPPSTQGSPKSGSQPASTPGSPKSGSKPASTTPSRVMVVKSGSALKPSPKAINPQLPSEAEQAKLKEHLLDEYKHVFGEGYDDITPEFIYGGPFIRVPKESPFLDMKTPINAKLQGTFKWSYAHRSLRDCMPVVITNAVDVLNRSMSGFDGKAKGVIEQISKFKHDFMTNKPYDKFTADTEEADLWNEWIDDLPQTRYFLNDWLFTECYMYRRLTDFAETKGLSDFDPFENQKREMFEKSLQPICTLASHVVGMLGESARDKKKADFVTLLKCCLWANKFGACLTYGIYSKLKEIPPPEPPPKPAKAGKGKKGKQEPKAAVNPKEEAKVEDPANQEPKFIDPVQMIVEFKDKLIVDDSPKAFENLMTKSDKMRTTIEKKTAFKEKCSCHRLAVAYKVAKCKSEEVVPPPPPPPAVEGAEPPPPPPEPPKVPCPAKITVPPCVQYDIVCEHAGYELFADLCFATFLVSQKIVERVRFHLKRYPWFVTHATRKDFMDIVRKAKDMSFTTEFKGPPGPDNTPGEPIRVNSEGVRNLGSRWEKYLEDQVFVIHTDPYWTYPHSYEVMKKYDYWMYRKLQLAVGILFKGDLNYRKLLGGKNWYPYTKFDASLQGFNPAPIIAARVIKCEMISGMPKGKFEAFNKIDAKWMETGNYGTIQFVAKAEPLKVADRPCPEYRNKCRGKGCPVNPDYNKPGPQEPPSNM